MNHTAVPLAGVLPKSWSDALTRYIGHCETGTVHWAWLFSLVTLSFAVYVAKGRRDQTFFTNESGQKIKEVQSDVRLWKFVRSAQLSRLGEDLAGNEPYLIQSGPYRELVISQPDHIHDFYRHDAKEHKKPCNFNLGEQFGRLMGNAVGTQYGDHWRRIRRHFDPIFAHHPTMQNLELFRSDIANTLKYLVLGSSRELDSKRSFMFLTFRLLSIHLYGDMFSEEMYQLLLKLNNQHEIVIRDMTMSKNMDSRLWNLVPTAASKRLSQYLHDWRYFNLAVIKDARERNLHCPVATIAFGIDQGDMQEKEFLQTLDEILFTNVEVSANVLNTLIRNLASNPTIQTKLHSEIMLQRKSGDSSLYTYFAYANSYLNCVVMESMRLSPAFWFSMPESTAILKRIGGYLIPAGTSVVIDTHRLNTGSLTWGKDGTLFDPDRFEEVPREKLRCGFMRFGVGAASGRCLGKNVADLVFKLVAVEVFGGFRVEIVDGNGDGDGKEGFCRFERLQACGTEQPNTGWLLGISQLCHD